MVGLYYRYEVHRRDCTLVVTFKLFNVKIWGWTRDPNGKKEQSAFFLVFRPRSLKIQERGVTFLFQRFVYVIKIQGERSSVC